MHNNVNYHREQAGTHEAAARLHAHECTRAGELNSSQCDVCVPMADY